MSVAIDDAVETYFHMVNFWGVDPSDLFLAGDSAGGALVLAVLRRVQQYRDNGAAGQPAAGRQFKKPGLLHGYLILVKL